MFAVAALLAASIAVPVSMVDSARDALRRSVSEDLGGREFAVQSTNPRAVEVLGGLDAFASIVDSIGVVSTMSAESPATVRVTNDASVQLGTLVSGRTASNSAEATASEELVNDLQLSLGDSLVVERDGELSGHTLVGITAHSANVDDRVVTAIDPTLSAEETTTWVADENPYAINALAPFFDDRSATFRSQQSLSEDRASDLPTSLSSLRYAPYGLGALIAAILVLVLTFGRAVVARDVETLAAAGAPRSAAWKKVSKVVAVALVLGEIVGFVLSLAVIKWQHSSISSLFGQNWVDVSPPLVLIAGVVVVTAVVVLTAPTGLNALFARLARSKVPSIGGRAVLVPAAIGVLIWSGVQQSGVRRPE